VKRIKLSRGKYTFVDDEDFERLNEFGWYASKGNGNNFYAQRRKCKIHVFMHREILPCPKGFQIDHIDGDGLNNQKKNLRVCTTSQNQFNRGKIKNSTSGYKGVTWDKRSKKWLAQININKEHKNLGLFDSKEDAALAYNIAAERYHGEFAKFNEITEATK
jgi:hypothetical protein